jgi:hypothetical protein
MLLKRAHAVAAGQRQEERVGYMGQAAYGAVRGSCLVAKQLATQWQLPTCQTVAKQLATPNAHGVITHTAPSCATQRDASTPQAAPAPHGMRQLWHHECK